ncbi:hypothetical protein IMSHALPRED_000368 [Imshaugia aleurites]|uniref:Glycosyltransferase family 92 protein n=1 Tax=Imshaugia aleurites TaxID=172621 RepID=A0A8H3EYI3_9LECA|nr:hypothetical protein IMSHALPRED_000368 [Imshaugia aleurites]
MAHLQSLSNDSWFHSIAFIPRRGCKYIGFCACLAFILLSLTWLRDIDKPIDKQTSTASSPPPQVPFKEFAFSSSDPESTLEDAGSIPNNSTVAFPPLPPPDDEEYVSLCLAIRDQPGDLNEFLAHYYYHHGIRRFYVMDDGSDPPLSYTPNFGVPPFAVPRSAVTFTYITRVPDRPQPFQHIIYADYCIKNFGERHTWMGFVDSDEFLEMRRETTLVDWLHQWENNDTVGALSVNWITHNSGGQLKRPQSDTRKGFGRCVVDLPKSNNAGDENSHVKSFAKTALFDGVNSVHYMRTADGSVSVGEKGDACGIKRPPTHDMWALHHYSVKSREQFLEKQQRGSPNNHHAAGEFWDRIEGADDYECPELAAYVP